MKALYFEKAGSLTELKLRELSPPAIEKTREALVRVKAAAINPSDPKNVLGKMSETTVPRVPGRDFAGTELLPLIRSGALTPPEVQAIRIEQAIDAYAHILSGKTRRKLVLSFG